MAIATTLSIGSAATTQAKVDVAMDLFLAYGPKAYSDKCREYGPDKCRSPMHNLAYLLGTEFYWVEQERKYAGNGYSPEKAERLLAGFEADAIHVRECALGNWTMHGMEPTIPLRLRQITDTIAAILEQLYCDNDYFDTDTAKDIFGCALHSLIFGSIYGHDAVYAITDCQTEHEVMADVMTHWRSL